jgi:hypothetical protein
MGLGNVYYELKWWRTATAIFTVFHIIALGAIVAACAADRGSPGLWGPRLRVLATQHAPNLPDILSVGIALFSMTWYLRHRLKRLAVKDKAFFSAAYVACSLELLPLLVALASWQAIALFRLAQCCIWILVLALITLSLRERRAKQEKCPR